MSKESVLQNYHRYHSFPRHTLHTLGYGNLEEALRDAMDIPEEIR